MFEYDNNFYKKKYGKSWIKGKKREVLFRKTFEDWGIEVIPFGFETESIKYNPKPPDEKGKPDYVIILNGEKIYFEVTGTDFDWVDDKEDLWVRPDKITYIENHNVNGYVCHVLNNKYNIIRFIDSNNILEKRIIIRNIRNEFTGIKSPERFLSFYPSESISLMDMYKILGLN